MRSVPTPLPPARGKSLPAGGSVPGTPREDDRPATAAVDFDGTIAEGPPHDIRAMRPRRGVREGMVELWDAGVQIVVWTARGDLEEVADWLDEEKIPYDHINDNPGQGEPSRKITADWYVDDRGVDGKQPFGDVVRHILKNARGKPRVRHIIITGFSGVGKSTFAQTLSKKTGLPIHHTDRDPLWRGNEAVADHPERYTPGTRAFRAYRKLLKKLVRRALKQDTPHILEGCQFLVAPGTLRGHRIVLLDAPEDLVVARRLGRDAGTGKLARQGESRRRRKARYLYRKLKPLVEKMKGFHGVEAVAPEEASAWIEKAGAGRKSFPSPLAPSRKSLPIGEKPTPPTLPKPKPPAAPEAPKPPGPKPAHEVTKEDLVPDQAPKPAAPPEPPVHEVEKADLVPEKPTPAPPKPPSPPATAPAPSPEGGQAGRKAEEFVSVFGTGALYHISEEMREAPEEDRPLWEEVRRLAREQLDRRRTEAAGASSREADALLASSGGDVVGAWRQARTNIYQADPDKEPLWREVERELKERMRQAKESLLEELRKPREEPRPPPAPPAPEVPPSAAKFSLPLAYPGKDHKGIFEQVRRVFAGAVPADGDLAPAYTALASCIGAPDDAVVHPTRWGEYKTVFDDDPAIEAEGIRVAVEGPSLDRMTRFLGIDKNGDKVIVNHIIQTKLHTRGEGLGREIFYRQCLWAARHGFKKIYTHAAGARGDEMNGYYTWPLLGYDQSLKEIAREDSGLALRIHHHFPRARSIRDLMLTDEGRKWWSEHGRDLHKAVFDLTPGSWSWYVLATYRDRKLKEKTMGKKALPEGGGGGGDRIDVPPEDLELLEAIWREAGEWVGKNKKEGGPTGWAGVKSLPYWVKTLGPYQYGCLMLLLPDALRRQLTDWALENVPDFHLAAEGRETIPHVTALYGYTDSSPATVAGIKKILAGYGPVPVRLASVTQFKGNPDGDVLKIDVESPLLRRLHGDLKASFPNEDKYPVYRPHVTLAYLDPAASSFYDGVEIPFLPCEAVLGVARWSPADGPTEDIPLSFLPPLGR